MHRIGNRFWRLSRPTGIAASIEVSKAYLQCNVAPNAQDNDSLARAFDLVQQFLGDWEG
jgi:hypothetical protein